MQNFLIALVTGSIAMSAIAILFLIASPLLSKRYSPKWQYYTWMVIIIGFIIPFRPDFNFTFLKVNIPFVQTIDRQAEQPVDPVTNPIDEAVYTPVTDTVNGPVAGNETAQPILPDNFASGIGDAGTAQPYEPPADIYSLVICIWLAGTIFAILYHASGHYRFMRMVGRWSEPVADEELLNALYETARDMAIFNQVNLRVCRLVKSPMMVGYVNPTIILHTDDFSSDELAFILRHELTHYKRKDLWFKTIVLIATAVHWFNPVIYLVSKEIAMQCEICCDLEVVRSADEKERQQYSETIISVIRQQSSLVTSLSTSFYGGKKGMKKRIFSIMDTATKKVGIAVVCGVILLTIGTGAAFEANTGAGSSAGQATNSVVIASDKQAANTDIVSFNKQAANTDAASSAGQPPIQSAVLSGGQAGSQSVSDSSAKYIPKTGLVKVGVCIYNSQDYFMTNYCEELKAYFLNKSNSDVWYEVKIVYAEGDPELQIEQVKAFMTERYDVLIANIVQMPDVPRVVDICKAADTPVIFVNREPRKEDLNLWDRASYVHVDYRQAGVFQGQIINELPDKGDINGDGKVSYVMITGDPDNLDAGYRTEFSVKAITDSGMKVEKLLEQSGMWSQSAGQEIAAAALAKYGNKIDVILCNNDSMALGALQAIKAAGRTVGKDIYLVGIDALDEVVSSIREGQFTGTVLNDPSRQARKAADVAIMAVNGLKLEREYIVDYLKITKATLADEEKKATPSAETNEAVYRDDTCEVFSYSQLKEAADSACKKIIVKKDLDVSGDFLRIGREKTLVIEKGVTVTVSMMNFVIEGQIVNGGIIKVSGRIGFYVESPDIGKIEAVNGGEISFFSGAIGADMIAYYLSNNSIYTSLSLVPGESTIKIDRNLTIPKGKTLWLNSMCTLEVQKGVALTVNGKLETYNKPIINGTVIGDIKVY